MKTNNLLFLFVLLVVGVISNIFPIKIACAQEELTEVQFFWGDGCPHCQKQKPFMEELAQKYPAIQFYDYEVYGNKANRDKMLEEAERLSVENVGVPMTIVGDQAFVGFLNEETTGREIETAIQQLVQKTDPISPVDTLTTPTPSPTPPPAVTQSQTEESQDSSIKLPIFGQIDPNLISIPLVTVMIAALDGFNPCAMWALVFLISLLLGLKDRKRMWILGTTFIITSGLVYFLFLSAWLNLFLFVGMIFWVRLGIGLLALGVGGYYLKTALEKSDTQCKVTASPQRRQVFEKLKALTQQKQFALAFVGIIALAIAVNLVELFCSAGLPAVYTQILALNQLPTWQYYSYLLLYILIFMLDDLIVFFTAMLTLKITGLEGKYARYSHIIGGVLMLIIGLLMLFKPEWLSFS